MHWILLGSTGSDAQFHVLMTIQHFQLLHILQHEQCTLCVLGTANTPEHILSRKEA